MARIVFGRDFVEEHTVVFSLINANSPLVWDATMLGAARAYAEANQAVMMTPFILAGAMSPSTVAATCAQTLAESLAGMAYVQLVRAGAPSCSARSRRRCRCGRALDVRHGAGAQGT
jgi:trimethylamine--corrinoid protein Co-methyltransferase